MFRKYLVFVILCAFTGLLWYLDGRIRNDLIAKLFYSGLAVSLPYLVLKLILEGLFSKKIKDTKARYSFRKTTQILFVLACFVVLLRIWVSNPQALLVAYGLVAAGVAVALQDVFKNFAGAITILLTGIYRVGDRIEINSRVGDVIDVGMFYTSLIELREWVDGDQTTGRITLLPNGLVLSSPVHNYTKDHNFIWEELSLPITFDSNWKLAVDVIHEIVVSRTSEATRLAEKEISTLEEKYYISKRNITPTIFITPTDNWIMLKIRYVVDARERRLVRNELLKSILEKIQAKEDVNIASQTLTVTEQHPSA